MKAHHNFSRAEQRNDEVLEANQMSYTEHPLLVTTVGEDRTFVLPDSIPGGATIGIIVLANTPKRPLTRKGCFQAALAEIEAAIIRSKHEPIRLPSDAELNALIERPQRATGGVNTIEPHAHSPRYKPTCSCIGASS